MKNYLSVLGFACLIFLVQCKSDISSPMVKPVPTVSDFNAEGSDAKAMAIADKVILACGGMKSWEEVKVIKWNFFGKRWLLWDKINQKVRIEHIQNDTKLILDLKNMNGKVFKYGKEWNDPDTLKKYLEGAYKTWINDSYWLTMPFKIKDGGVHLNYLKEDTTRTGILSDVITMTFDSVGVTPKNKYEVWVGKNSNLVAQWAYYPNNKDSVPAIVSPWDAYIKYGGVFLSSDRGPNRQLSGIKVYSELPAEVFSAFNPIDFEHF